MTTEFLIRAAWIAAALPTVAACIPSSKLNGYRQIFLRVLGRGKIMDSSSKNYFTVPQKLFAHFYALGVAWTTFLLITTWLCAYKTSSSSSHSSQEHISSYGMWRSVFLLLLMEFQVLRRLFESIYVFKYSPSAKMHISAYPVGMLYYIAAPLSLCCTHASDLYVFLTNSFPELYSKGLNFDGFDFSGHVTPLLHLKPYYAWIGAAVFTWGWLHQLRCHAILGSLRKNGKRDHGYAIPNGDWFEYVSSPHYLAEIVIYGGLVIASGLCDITTWLLFGFVVTNLSVAAEVTHKWYLHKFENYPRNRRAIIPFVY